MTREEAIKHLEEWKEVISSRYRKEAIDMAIEALRNCSEKPNNSTDLINRSDAVKPFCVAPDGTRIPEVDCDNFPVEFSVEFIKKHLLSLPSADAVQIPIKLEKRYPQSRDEDITDAFMRGYLAGRSSAGRPTGWIPVSERLPEKDGSFLVYMSWNYHDMDVLKWADGWNCIRRINGKVDRENEIDGADIIAWMPLPEPYEGGNDKYVD